MEYDDFYCSQDGCSGLLEVVHAVQPSSGGPAEVLSETDHFLMRKISNQPHDVSGVWRFREFVLPALRTGQIVTQAEGNTGLYRFQKTEQWLGMENVAFKHEGQNPTGSFKDRGMTVAMSWARAQGANVVACASTGNTSASVASYASRAGLPAVILIPEKATAIGKVSQALAYGALTLKVRGNFDDALKLLMEAKDQLGLAVMNSLNPMRLEGQKTIMWEMLEQREWIAPDWVVVPGGNLGNVSAFHKALKEALSYGWIDTMPKLGVVQARGANPFASSWANGTPYTPVLNPETHASAIRIGAPVNYPKAVRAVQETGGCVVDVIEQDIRDAKALIDSDGVGCEPASATTVAGLRVMIDKGYVLSDDAVVAVLTGHVLKDPDATIAYHSGGDTSAEPNVFANPPMTINPTLEELSDAIQDISKR